MQIWLLLRCLARLKSLTIRSVEWKLDRLLLRYPLLALLSLSVIPYGHAHLQIVGMTFAFLYELFLTQSTGSSCHFLWSSLSHHSETIVFLIQVLLSFSFSCCLSLLCLKHTLDCWLSCSFSSWSWQLFSFTVAFIYFRFTLRTCQFLRWKLRRVLTSLHRFIYIRTERFDDVSNENILRRGSTYVCHSRENYCLANFQCDTIYSINFLWQRNFSRIFASSFFIQSSFSVLYSILMNFLSQQLTRYKHLLSITDSQISFVCQFWFLLEFSSSTVESTYVKTNLSTNTQARFSWSTSSY